MNLTEYKQKYGIRAIPSLVERTGWPYSQFYRVMAGTGAGGMSLARARELSKIEPQLDAVRVHEEWRENRERKVNS